MDNKTEQSCTRYNQIAHGYDDSFDGKFTLPFNQFICDYVNLKNNDSVLDAACGNGRLLKMLSQKARINAYGIDISEEMIMTAQNNYKDAAFSVCSADNIEYPDKMFDLVTVCCAFHHFTKPDAFMRETYRILKENGKLIIADPYPFTVIRWIENLVILCFKMGDVRIYGIRKLLGFFKKAGFENISSIKKGSMIIVEGIKIGHSY